MPLAKTTGILNVLL